MAKSYCLSLTGAGTYQAETVLTARAYLETPDWAEVRKLIAEENLLGFNTDGHRRRIGSEIIKRLRTLSSDELEMLASATGDDLAALTWLAICRTYPLAYGLSGDVLAGRFERMLPDLPKTAYRAFVEEQAFDHPELAALTESSLKKVETRLFGMMRDCRLINEAFEITPLYPSPRLVDTIRAFRPQDLELFPKAGVLL